eukprot:2173203-Rhodomonas_salina.1
MRPAKAGSCAARLPSFAKITSGESALVGRDEGEGAEWWWRGKRHAERRHAKEDRGWEGGSKEEEARRERVGEEEREGESERGRGRAREQESSADSRWEKEGPASHTVAREKERRLRV